MLTHHSNDTEITTLNNNLNLHSKYDKLNVTRNLKIFYFYTDKPDDCSRQKNLHFLQHDDTEADFPKIHSSKNGESVKSRILHIYMIYSLDII